MLTDILLSGFIYGAFAGLIAFFVSPLQYLKIIRQETGHSYRKILANTISRERPLFVFFHGAIPYVLMNFLSNMSFGISDYISDLFLVGNYNLFFGVVFRSLLGGFIETVFTIYPEVKEIIKNKGNLAKDDGQILKIIFPIMIRNSIAWLGATFTYEISLRFTMEIAELVLLSFFFGIVFGVASIPMDVIATQNCGSNEKLTSLQRATKIFNESKLMLLSGSIIRIIQIGIFTVVTFLTMMFIR